MVKPCPGTGDDSASCSALLASIAARDTTRLPITCATFSPRPTLLLLVPTPICQSTWHRPVTRVLIAPLPHHLNATAASPSPRFSSDLQSRPINQRHATPRPIRLAFTSRLCISPSPPCASCTPRRFLTRQACRIPDSTAGQRIRAVYLARRRLVLMRTGVAICGMLSCSQPFALPKITSLENRIETNTPFDTSI